MTTYTVRSAFSLVSIKVGTDSTLELRRRCRELLPRRLSARCVYQMIGSNSFRVELAGVALLHAYREQENVGA